MDTGPQLGKLITDGDRRRDAIHIAVASVVAGEPLEPGQRIGFREGTEAVYGASPWVPTVGVVDPFIPAEVAEGERFWILLFP